MLHERKTRRIFLQQDLLSLSNRTIKIAGKMSQDDSAEPSDNGLSDVYGKDMRGCETMDLITWKAANWTLEELEISDRYQLTDKAPHRPTNLSPNEVMCYNKLYEYYFFWLCKKGKQYWDTKNIGKAPTA